jgi:hypothetical protein
MESNLWVDLLSDAMDITPPISKSEPTEEELMFGSDSDLEHLKQEAAQWEQGPNWSRTISDAMKAAEITLQAVVDQVLTNHVHCQS